MVNSVINQDQETEAPDVPLEGNLSPAKDSKRGSLLGWSEHPLNDGVKILSYTGTVIFIGANPYVIPSGNHSQVVELVDLFDRKFNRHRDRRLNLWAVPYGDLRVGRRGDRPGTRTFDALAVCRGWFIPGLRNGMPVRVSFHRVKKVTEENEPYFDTIGWVIAYPPPRKKALAPVKKVASQPAAGSHSRLSSLGLSTSLCLHWEVFSFS
jgi:hypothetical protein